MSNKHQIEMLKQCVGEITSLRIQIERLEPKADAYDTLRQVIHLLPQPSQGYGEDLVYKLEREIEEWEKES